METPAAGGYKETPIIMNTEATAPVRTKTPSMEKRILPSRRPLVIPATAEEMEKNTRGTRAVKRRLRKISPSGLRRAASSLRRSPSPEPIPMEKSSSSEKP